MANQNPIGSATGTFANGSQNTPYTIYETTLLQGFSDPDGDELTLAGFWVDSGELTDLGNGSWSFVPEANYSGNVAFDYVFIDSKGGEIQGALNLIIAAPSNYAPTGGVTISGSVYQGSNSGMINTLADANGLGVFSYQWLRDGVFINGATQEIYQNQQADVSKALSVKVSYTDGLGKLESVTSPSVTILNVNDTPTGTVLITGAPTQGQTLTASNTLADTDGLGAINYQWLSNGAVISGATGNNYVLAQTDVGKAISVQASYIDLLGTAESVLSNQTVAVSAKANSLPTGSVTFTGNPIQGQTLVASNSLADADGLGTISYQWSRAGTAISGATQTTYTLTQADVGKTVLVTASYTDKLGAFESVRSLSTPSIANINDAPTGSVVIAGNSTQGQTLTASNTLADADGLGAISYQWLRAGTPIVGATQSSYILGQSDVGRAISVQANYVDPWGTSESVQSTQTSAIAPKANSLPIGNVNISGTPTQGQTLFASNNLSDADGLGAINYQWLRAGTVISGATQSNYTLTQSDVSKSITVKASYTDLTGVAESVTSNATLSIANINDLPIGVVSINGTAKIGQTLTASNNLSDADGLGSISYQWLRSGYVISGANQSSYILTSNDVNSTISVKASYTDGFGTQEAVTSSATAIITSSNNTPTGYATASLTSSLKNTTYTVYAANLLQGFSDADGDLLTVTNLSATNGSISNNGNNTWTLTPNTNFVGTISLYYNVTDSKSTPLSASQSLTINQGQVPPTGSVFINGTPQQKQTLTAGNSLADANGLGTINYQWLSNGNVLSGANQNFYTLTQAEVGKTISVTTSYTDGLGKLENVSSYATYSVSNVNDLPKGSVYITGKPNQNQVLTASNDISDVDGLGTIYYQWLRNGYTINYANQSSYTLTANDVNSTISVKASYQDNFGTNESVVSSSITALPPINRPPVGAAQTNNSGVEDNNYTLYSSLFLNGFFDPDGDLLSVTNLSATHAKISTNSDGTWLLTPDQNFNGTVQFNYSVQDNKGGSVNATLNFLLSPVNDLPTGAVTIVGELNQGKVLTATNTISDGDGLGTISYQWLRYGAMINGANQSTYTLTSNDVNAYISVKASYIDGNGTTESMASSGVTGLPPAQTSPTGNVTISGILQQNQVISAMNTLADINGLGAINYQWLSNGNAISGAVQNSYTLTQTDVGKTLSVKASYSDGLGKLESVTSQISSSVKNVNDLPKGFVYINGMPMKGQTLTAGNNLSDVDGLGTISYQWLRNGESVFNANNPSYTLTQADADKSISVKASYLDLQGTSESVTSTGLQIAAINQLSVNSPNVNEGDAGSKELTFTLTLSKSVLQTGSVDYTLQSGTAIAGIDFSSVYGTIQFNPGEISKTITVPVLGDTSIENDEKLNLVLSNPLILELSNGSTSMTTTGTIRNDDFPTLILSDSQSLQEGNTGQSAFTYTAKLSQSAPFDISVDYVTQSITATVGQDFTSQSGTVKFLAGEKEKTISVQVISDTKDEADETLAFVLNNPQNAKFANSVNELRSIGTILNDDSQTLRLNSPVLNEGDSGLNYLKFVLNLGYAVNSDVTFEYKTDDGTATGDTDYLVNSNTGTIVAGTTTTEIPISIIGDSRIEPNETIKLTINTIKGITLPGNSLPIMGLGTIINDDLPVVTLLTTKTVYEPAVGVKRWDIPITLNAIASTDSVISYHTESGSALQEKDFANTKGQIIIAANTNTGVIYIPVLADSEQELDEIFKVIIDKVEGGAKLPIGQNSLSSDITISNLSVPELTMQNVQIVEGDSGNKNLTFKVTLSSISTLPVSFTMRTVDKTATAGQDYQAIVTTTNTIPVGTQSLDITVPIIGDKISESDETFGLELSKLNNAVFNNGNDIFTATGTILDDDKPIIRIDDVHVTEGNTGIHDEKIKVTLSAPAALPVTIHYSSVDGTAKAGEDFIKVDNTLVIPVGAKEGSISLSIQGDTIPESAQDFHIQLSSPINAQFLNTALTIQNTVTIDSDDADKLPIVSVTKNLAIDEGDNGITNFPIILKLSTPATDILTVHYETVGIDAKAGSDFIAASGNVTFLAGESSQIISLSVYGDVDTESDEDFTLLLTDPQGMRFNDSLPAQELTLLIRDDDAELPQKLEGTVQNDVLDTTKEGGGSGDDSLDGKKGADTLIGGDGNDTYYVDNIKDVIVEDDQSQSNAGDDDLVHSTAASYILPTNVEYLIIDGKLKGNATGNELDNKMIGNLAVNVLSGLAGNDILDGGSGKDTLTGGDGSDTFIFSQGIKGNKNIDTVKDFVHGQDRIYLNADIFSKLATAVGFVSGNVPLSLAKVDSRFLVSAAKVKSVDASSYLLYDTKTGVLAYDEDGSGKLVASSFVTLTGKPALTLEDFWFFG